MSKNQEHPDRDYEDKLYSKSGLKKDNPVMHDAGAKLILNSPSYLSLILTHVCPELFPMSPQELAGRIKKEDPLYHGSEAAGLRSDLTSPEKTTAEYGKNIFDALHLVTLTDGRSYFVNSEVQKVFPAVAELAGRIVFYLGVQISTQKNDRSGFRKTDYQKFRPVSSIWILPEAAGNFHYKGRMIFQAESDDGRQPKAARLAGRLSELLQVDIVGLDARWHLKPESEAIECLGMIFRTEADEESRREYLKQGGIEVENADMLIHGKHFYELSIEDVYEMQRETRNIRAEMKRKLEEKDSEIDRLKEENARLRLQFEKSE